MHRYGLFTYIKPPFEKCTDMVPSGRVPEGSFCRELQRATPPLDHGRAGREPPLLGQVIRQRVPYPSFHFFVRGLMYLWPFSSGPFVCMYVCQGLAVGFGWDEFEEFFRSGNRWPLVNRLKTKPKMRPVRLIGYWTKNMLMVMGWERDYDYDNKENINEKCRFVEGISWEKYQGKIGLRASTF